MDFKRGVGIFLFSLGGFLIVNSGTQMTAAVIGAKPIPALNLILGLIFFIAGLMLASKSEESLEKKVKHRPGVEVRTPAEVYYRKRELLLEQIRGHI